MNIKEFYTSIESDYDNIKQRLNSDEMIKRFLIKFKDEPSFYNLQNAISDQKFSEAFRFAHTLKGICLNLEFNNLFHPVNILTDMLRTEDNINTNISNIPTVFNNIKKQYLNIIEKINKIN